MSSLRNILRRCARKASIPGGTPLQIQCTFNPVYSAYPTSISRQAYSSDANEAPKNANDSVQKYFREMMNAKNARLKIPEDQNATQSFTADSPQKTSFGQIDLIKSPPNIPEDQKAHKSPTFNKNLNLRKYYIGITGLSKETTPESLRKFYSQFGEIAFCAVMFPGERKQFGSVAFTSREAVDRALNSLPHCIDGKDIDDVRQGTIGRKQLTLQVVDLSPKTTTESLKAFYSQFGRLNNCSIKKASTGIGQVGEVTFSNQKNMHRALDAQPHVIDGSEVFLQYATFELDLFIGNVPEGITEKALLALYSKYGRLRECRLHKAKTDMAYIWNAYVSFSAIDEVNRAMADRPHIIDGRPLRTKFLGRGEGLVSLFVGSLPENVTEETLRKEFSKYGKPVYWKLNNDGHFNQSRPYGIVTYGTDEEALNALNSGPHTIEGSVVDVRRMSETKTSSSKQKSYN